MIMLNRHFLRASASFVHKKYNKKLEFRLLNNFSGQISKIALSAHNNNNNNGGNANGKKNTDFMNFQAFIEKMKV